VTGTMTGSLTGIMTGMQGVAVSIGLPRERKDLERRIVLTPSSVALVTSAGHRVLVETGAGRGAGFADDDYRAAGAEVVTSAADAWAADIVVKVKEPIAEEYGHLRAGLTLFSYLHLAAERELTERLLTSGTSAFAFETLRDTSLPLLAPMSEIAGRAAAIIAAAQLSTAGQGSGTLVGGAAGVPPARAVVIGMGVAGTMAARGLRGLDAHVTGVDLDLALLSERRRDGTLDATQASEPQALDALIAEADILIGAALVPGARAPRLVSAAQVASMRPGSVVIDLAIDQGGCIATARPTTLSEPTYLEHGVVHYCVTNVPGQFPRTASAALSAAVAPRLVALAAHARSGAVHDPERASGLPRVAEAANIVGHVVVHPGVAAAHQHLPVTTQDRAPALPGSASPTA
jgi:alanine dehydrogenase